MPKAVFIAPMCDLISDFYSALELCRDNVTRRIQPHGRAQREAQKLVKLQTLGVISEFFCRKTLSPSLFFVVSPTHKQLYG